MQDPATRAAFEALAAARNQNNSLFPEQEQLKCPRCDSTNTKFCYFNNYNLSQPRHFCKNCRRYWTKGGSLRNVPVGGRTRKASSKRSNPDPIPDQDMSTRRATEQKSPPPPPSTSLTREPDRGICPTALDRVHRVEAEEGRKTLDMDTMGGNFSSVLDTDKNFGSVFDGLGRNGSALVQLGGYGEGLNSGSESGLGRTIHLNGDDDGRTSGYSHKGWPILAIYTPSRSHKQ